MQLDQASISNFAIALLRQNSLDELMRELANQIGKILGYEDAVIYLVQGESQLQQVAALGSKNSGDNHVSNPLRISIGERIAGFAASSGQAEIVPNTANDPRYVADNFEGRSEIAVPIIHRDTVIGVIDCESRQLNAFSQTDTNHLTTLANIIAPRVAHARNQQNLVQSQTQQVESLSIFVGGIAHDFNNNLQAINSSLSAIKPQSDRQMGPLLDVAQQAIKKSQGLTDQLLAFAKGSSLQAQTIDLIQLVHETASIALTSRRSTYNINVIGEIENVDIHCSQIEQVVSNLLINADQAYPNGGRIEIQLSAQAMPEDDFRNGVLIQIEDFGVGIAKEDQQLIFQPDYSTKPAGNGLGLAVSYFIVQRHQGHLTVESEAGKGSTFRLFLPCNSSEFVAGVAKEQVTDSRPRVLLIDDDNMVQQSVAACLTSLGYEPITASSEAEAISKLRLAVENKTPIATLIIDLNLPNSDGVTILNQLKKISPNVPAILTSGLGVSPVFKTPQEFGFSDVLAKPFNLRTLKETLERVIENTPN